MKPCTNTSSGVHRFLSDGANTHPCAFCGLTMAEANRTDPASTLRDQFAMSALTGLVAHCPPEAIARQAYALADAKIAERNK